MSTPSEIIPGDFSTLPMDDNVKKMLTDAYNAVTKHDLWDYMKTYNPYSNPMSDEMRLIQSSIQYPHDRMTYTYTIREMIIIAKDGWKPYVESVVSLMNECCMD